MSETRRQRIAAVLGEYPEGVPTPLIARLAGEDMTNRGRALRKCWNRLTEMAADGEVVRVPTTGRESEWRFVPTRLRSLYKAIAKSDAAWKSLTVEEWAEQGITEEAWQECLGHYRALAQRELDRVSTATCENRQ